jgi:hypothetical protein
VVISGAAVSAVIVQPEDNWVRNSPQLLYQKLAFPTLEDTPTGSLEDRVLQTLMSTTKALAGLPVELAHYEDYFRWHAETVPGYKTLYERFAATVERSAGCNFSDCDIETQRKILASAFETRTSPGRLDRLRRGVLDRDWLLYDEYVVREILALFARTDAWILLGYDAWPGMPRGLESYRQLPDVG